MKQVSVTQSQTDRLTPPVDYSRGMIIKILEAIHFNALESNTDLLEQLFGVLASFVAPTSKVPFSAATSHLAFATNVLYWLSVTYANAEEKKFHPAAINALHHLLSSQSDFMKLITGV